MEVEAVDEGTLAKILVPDGTENVAVNTPIAVITEEGEDISAVVATNGATPPSQVADSASCDGRGRQAREQGRREAGLDGQDRVRRRRLPPDVASAGAPEIPDGTKLVTTTVREALRDAMAEEMRRDGDVFVMGEEVGRVPGRLQDHAGLAGRVRAGRASSTRRSPSTASPASASARRWRGLRPIVEFMTWNFAMQAIDQIINSAAKTLYMSGGQMGAPIVFRGPNGAASPGGRPAQPGLFPPGTRPCRV